MTDDLESGTHEGTIPISDLLAVPVTGNGDGAGAEIPGDWCRACGTGGQVGHTCSACGATTTPWVPPASRVGLTYRVAGKLKVTKRLAICIDEADGAAVLHIGAKDKEAAVATPVDALGEPSTDVDADLSPAGRLHHALRTMEDTKQGWDAARLAARAGQLVDGNLPAIRRLADEALARGWDDLFESLPLTGPEKVWRRAHEAACFGRVTDLRTHLERLPAEGYAARVRLAIPFAGAIADEIAAWRELVDRWVGHGLAGAEALRRLIDPAWDVALDAAIGLVPPERAGDWRRVLRGLRDGTAVAPIAVTPGWWRAADIYLRGAAGTVVDGELDAVAGLDIGLLEDLVDAGGLTGTAPLAVVPAPGQDVLRARLAPAELTSEALAGVGHTAELARRAFLERDRTELGRLADGEAVRHYTALLDARETGEVDEERLRGDVVALLRLAERALKAVRAGEASSLPAPLLKDPTLWPMFDELARGGQLSPDAETRAAHPAFGHWCDLQRLLGLVWEQRWNDAITLGQGLAPSLTTERYHDEALNLTAFAMTQVGRHREALQLLEDAMAGAYTEALLVNTGHTATRVGPEVAVPHLIRIVREAPTRDLRANALRQAVGVWMAAASKDDKPSFPPELAEALETVLRTGCSFDDYVLFSQVAADVEPAIMQRLPAPADERAGPYRVFHGRARFRLEDDFLLPDLADVYVSVAKEFGRAGWFETAWRQTVDAVAGSVFVDFGDAPGSALFIDRVNMAMPELFPKVQRYILVAQAGAHLAAAFSKDDATLNEEKAFPKFFFVPIEEFLAERHKLDAQQAAGVAENFHLTLSVAGAHYLLVSRTSTTDPYNALVERQRWDYQNAPAIRRQMAAILAEDAKAQVFVDRVLDRLGRLEVDTDRSRERQRELETKLAEWRAETVRLRARL